MGVIDILACFLVLSVMFCSAGAGGVASQHRRNSLFSGHHRRLLTSAAVAQIRNGRDFVSALLDPAVEVIFLAAPIVDVTAEIWNDFELPVVISRNISVEGDPLDWPLLRFHYVRDKVRLMDGVTWILRFIFLDGAYGDNASREQGFTVLSPTLPKQASTVWIGPAGVCFRICFPSIPGSNPRAPERPASYPGTQVLLFDQPQLGCTNGSSVPPMRRCWLSKTLIEDVAGDGVRMDASDKPVYTNIMFWMRNVSAFCEVEVSAACIVQQREPLVCFNEKFRLYANNTASSLDDYRPEPGPPGPPPGVEGGVVMGGGEAAAGGAGGGGVNRVGRANSVVHAAVAGAVVAAIALLALSAALVIWARRRRRSLERAVVAAAEAATAKEAAGGRSESHGQQPGADADPPNDECCSTPAPRATVCSGTAAFLDTTIVATDGASSDSSSPRRSSAGEEESGPGSGPGAGKLRLSADTGPLLDAPVTPQTPPRSALDLHVQLTGSGLPPLGDVGAADAAAGRGGYADAAGAERELQRQQQQQQGGLCTPSAGAYGEASAGGSDRSSAGGDGDGDDGGDGSCSGTGSGRGSGSGSDSGRKGGRLVVELLPVVRGKGMFGRVVEGLYGGQRVAVKLLGGEGPWDPPAEELAESFAQEVQVLSRCQHPNVVQLLAASVDGPRLCLVMELMETSLERLIHHAGEGAGGVQTHGGRSSPPRGSAAAAAASGIAVAAAVDAGLESRLPLQKVLHIGISMATALAYLHPTISHRDLKPANVLLNEAHSERPVVKLTDFGLARLRVTVVPTEHPDAGTPPYMAPECFDVKKSCVTHKADMYSLGVVLWEMLTGASPWEGSNPLAVALLVAYKGKRLPLSGLDESRCPPKLARLLAACWEADPDRRPAAAEAAKELALVLQRVKMRAQQQSGGIH